MTRPLRVGVLGAGGISAAHLQAWSAVGATVRVHSPTRGAAVAERYGLRAAASVEDLLDWADVADVCTPTPTHLPLVLSAVAAGCHVLCEKPLARTVRDARATTRAALAAGVQLYPAHVVRYFPAYRALRRAVDDGTLGQPHTLRFSRAGAAPVPEWFFDLAASGGILMDQMVHDLDQARWIAGEVTQVHADQRPSSTGGVVPRPVEATVRLTHAGGARSQLTGRWGPPGTPFRTTFEVIGDRRALRHDSTGTDDPRPDELAAGASSDAAYLPPVAGTQSPYLLQIREMAAAFRGGPPPRVTAEDGVQAVALAEAALESLAVGAPVTIAT